MGFKIQNYTPVANYNMSYAANNKRYSACTTEEYLPNADTVELNSKKIENESNLLKNNKIKTGLIASVAITLGIAFGHRAIKFSKNLESFSKISNSIVKDAMKEEKFFNMKILKDLSNQEKQILYNSILSGQEAETFFATINGNKPACLIGGGANVSFLEKLNENLDIAKSFEILPLSYRGSNTQLYLVNKKSVIDTINRNKNLYIFRLKMNPNSTAEEIYAKLGANSKIFLDPTVNSKYNDLTGITLGFPKLSSMMFELERCKDEVEYTVRKNPKLYKEILLKKLYSEFSPYKNLPKEEFCELESAIKNYSGTIEETSNPYYKYVALADEPKEFERITNAIKDFINSFSIDKYM